MKLKRHALTKLELFRLPPMSWPELPRSEYGEPAFYDVNNGKFVIQFGSTYIQFVTFVLSIPPWRRSSLVTSRTLWSVQVCKEGVLIRRPSSLVQTTGDIVCM